jgi:hypothetical protein
MIGLLQEFEVASDWFTGLRSEGVLEPGNRNWRAGSLAISVPCLDVSSREGAYLNAPLTFKLATVLLAAACSE